MEYQNNQMTNNEQLKNALEGVRKAVQGEREDELFYDYLIIEAPTREQKEIITSIRDDERRHNKLFRRIYQDFTGKELPMDEEENFEAPVSYIEGIKKALFGELGAVERYRAIRRGLPRGIYRDVLFDIITDELKHASKYNYLFTLNSTMSNSYMNESEMIQDMPNTNNTAATTNSSNMGSITSTTTDAGNTGSTAGSTMNTSNFTPDDWVKYIAPLVNRALSKSKEGINPEHLYQEFILSGVLVGLGKKPQEAIEQVETWGKTGASKLLAMSKMSRYFRDLDDIK